MTNETPAPDTQSGGRPADTSLATAMFTAFCHKWLGSHRRGTKLSEALADLGALLVQDRLETLDGYRRRVQTESAAALQEARDRTWPLVEYFRKENPSEGTRGDFAGVSEVESALRVMREQAEVIAALRLARDVELRAQCDLTDAAESTIAGLREQVEGLRAPSEATIDERRERLGRRVRDLRLMWAREQPSPKATWLLPWDGLSEPDREVDRRIGSALWGDGFRDGMESGLAMSAAVSPAATRPVPPAQEPHRALLVALSGWDRLSDSLLVDGEFVYRFIHWPEGVELDIPTWVINNTAAPGDGALPPRGDA